MSEFDPYIFTEICDGNLWVRLRSGERLLVECTVPVEGVLRMRVGPPSPAEPQSPMLVPFPHRSASLTTTETDVVISGPGVTARWARDGQRFEMGAYRRCPDPSSSNLPIFAGRRAPQKDRPGGWIETVWLGPDAGVYGGGESFQGLNLRGRHRRFRNVQENRADGRDTAYMNVPFLFSDDGWGLFVHTGTVVDADLCATHSEYAWLDIEDQTLDMFLITGDVPTILQRYLTITGFPGRLPDWAFGVWMGRSSYFTAQEVEDILAELRAADCPVDVLHVDEWLKEKVLDVSAWNTDADRSRFPEGWTRRLAEQGVHVSLWHNPYVTKGTPLARELESKGFLLVDAKGRPASTEDNPNDFVIDFTNPQADTWWRQRLATSLQEEGHTAVMADFGEEIPAHAVFRNGRRGIDLRNMYSLLYQRAVWTAGMETRKGDFVPLTRSGTAGSQRYPSHWVGDMPSSWSGLVSSLRACLSMSLSGFAVVTHDAGGYWTPLSYPFAKVLRETMTPHAVEADVDPELYGRWVQWAAFSPIMRFHGVGRREPTAYPEPVRSAAIAACRFRKRLQRYVTEVASEASTSGIPVMRPMILAYPGDRVARDADLQYLLGPDVLVAPILEAGGKRAFWIPPGEWQPLCGLAPLRGPGWTTVECGPQDFPAYVRDGARVI
jgi:alpha-D-xyloside xylohydrolase